MFWFIYRTRAIITRGLYISTQLLKSKNIFSRGFFLKILALCMVSIQERLSIKSRMMKIKISKIMKKLSEQQTPKVLKDFCESTSLDGYNHLHIADSVLTKIFWGVIILLATGTGLSFLVTNTKAYMQATIVTNIESSSDNLHVSTVRAPS